MKRLPPAKRNQLIGVVIATAGLICLVYFVLISQQKKSNYDLALKIRDANLRLDQYKAAGREKTNTIVELAGLNQQLEGAETDVAAGDLYAWTVDRVRTFKAQYKDKVEIPTVGQPSQSDCDLIGDIPYKQIRFTLTGTAYYHDLGKFISDFENKFIHCRVVNLMLSPVAEGSTAGEKLSFRFDIVALVKPNN
jgi:hypothetical protein